MRILAATDGSDSAEHAITFAAKLTAAFKAHLTIIHVINLGTLPLDKLKDYSLSEHISLGDTLNTFAEEALATARAQAETLGVSGIALECPFGDAAEAIIASAREHQMDIVVVGRRGRGRLAGLLLGSVSQKIVSVASCPVIVVP